MAGLSTREQKVDWMIENKDLWWDKELSPMDEDWIARRMIDERLYGKGTSMNSIGAGLKNLIHEAKSKMGEVKPTPKVHVGVDFGFSESYSVAHHLE